jgi:hypothetical protein
VNAIPVGRNAKDPEIFNGKTIITANSELSAVVSIRNFVMNAVLNKILDNMM